MHLPSLQACFIRKREWQSFFSPRGRRPHSGRRPLSLFGPDMPRGAPRFPVIFKLSLQLPSHCSIFVIVVICIFL